MQKMSQIERVPLNVEHTLEADCKNVRNDEKLEN